MDDSEQNQKSNSEKAVTTPNARLRSKQTTPESTQRELKKLEDYWTRKNPVIDNSPRLRSKRKVNFDIKEKQPNSKNKPSPPASPVGDRNEQNEHRDLQDAPLTEPDFVAAFVTTYSEEVRDSDTSNIDDDDYIPPRKKLRSEVTNDELWEGIPLTVSFKRLAPISKRYSDSSNEYVGTEQTLDLGKEIESKDVDSGDQDHLEASVSNKLEEVKEHNGQFVQEKSCDVTINDGINERLIPDMHITSTSKPVLNQEQVDNPHDALRKCEADPKGQLCVTRSASSIVACNKTLSQILLPDCENTAEDSETDIYHGTERSQGDKSTSSDQSTRGISQTYHNFDKKNNEVAEASADPEHIQINSDIIPSLQSDNTPMRRSRRLSENEKRKSQQNTPNAKIDINSQNIPEEVEFELTHVETSLDANTLQDHQAEVQSEQSSQKLTFGPIKLNKNHRKIPPLRIRLKQPACAKKKTSKPMEKDNNTAKAGTSNTCNKKETDKIDANEKKKTKQSGNRKYTDTFADGTQRVARLVDLKKDAEEHTNKIKETNGHIDNNNGRDKQNTNKKEKRNKKQELTKKSGSRRNGKKHSLRKQSPDKQNPEKKEQVEKPTNIESDKITTNQSPPAGTSNKMELRLNNVRRISAASELLSNSLLNKHACVLWSSENRRYVQLSNPNATITALDDILIKKWGNLSEREKIRYFQRARDALKEENRHSNRRNNEKQGGDDNTTTPSRHGIESFKAMSPALQMTEIKKWLNLYHGISPEHCALVISSFKSCLSEENLERDARLQEKSKQKSKCKKTKRQKKVDRQPEVIDSCSRYRKLLYGKILESKETFVDLLGEQKKAHSQRILDNFSALVKRLVAGEVVHFAGDIRSDKLTEALYDLRALERENKVSITGDNQNDEHFDEILKCLQNHDSYGENVLNSLEQTDIDFQNVEQICKKIEDIPTLTSSTVTRLLPDVSVPLYENEEVNVLATTRLESDGNPVTLLTDWVADDILTRQPKICFRRAVSLLSNKIVPSPTLIMAQSLDGANYGSNKTQNCNVMFTHIKKALQGNSEKYSRHDHITT